MDLIELGPFQVTGQGLPVAPSGPRPAGRSRCLFCLESISGERLRPQRREVGPSTRRFWEGSPQPFSS